MAVRSTRALDHEILSVPDRARLASRVRLTFNMFGVLLGLFCAVALGLWLLLAGVPIFGIAAGVLGLCALACFGIARAVHRRSGPIYDDVRLDLRGVRTEGGELRWADVGGISVEPYPFVDDSHVYAVRVEGQPASLWMGAGMDRGELVLLVNYLRIHWKEGRRRAPDSAPDPDDDGLEALDRLLGEGKTRRD